MVLMARTMDNMVQLVVNSSLIGKLCKMFLILQYLYQGQATKSNSFTPLSSLRFQDGRGVTTIEATEASASSLFCLTIITYNYSDPYSVNTC